MAAALTINTMPEATLKAFADHGQVGAVLSPEEDEPENVLAAFAASGIDVDALAAKLQEEGARSFVDSWNALMAVIDSKAAAFR